MAAELKPRNEGATVTHIQGGEYTPDSDPPDKDGETTQVIIIQEAEAPETRWKKIKDFIFWFLLIDAFFK